MRIALLKSAMTANTELRSAPLRSAPLRSAQMRFGMMRGFSSRHAFHAATPILSRALSSSFAMRVVQHDCRGYATILRHRSAATGLRSRPFFFMYSAKLKK